MLMFGKSGFLVICAKDAALNRLCGLWKAVFLVGQLLYHKNARMS